MQVCMFAGVHMHMHVCRCACVACMFAGVHICSICACKHAFVWHARLQVCVCTVYMFTAVHMRGICVCRCAHVWPPRCVCVCVCVCVSLSVRACRHPGGLSPNHGLLLHPCCGCELPLCRPVLTPQGPQANKTKLSAWPARDSIPAPLPTEASAPLPRAQPPVHVQDDTGVLHGL